KALIKLQGFHSTFGEDSKIYSLDEVIEQFELYKEGQKQEEDIRLKYLEFIRNFKERNMEDFRRIKRFPMKARALRKTEEVTPESSVCLLRTDDKKQLYQIGSENEVQGLTFEEAVKLFEAKEAEQSQGKLPQWHYRQVNRAEQQYQKDIREETPENALTDRKDVRYNRAIRFLKD